MFQMDPGREETGRVARPIDLRARPHAKESAVMKSRILIAGLLAVLCAALTAAAPGGGRSTMVVHEWGTFLGMNGSDGVSLDGMYHEEHALPAFVHARGKDQLRIRSAMIKGETPVIYFYAKRPQQVSVRVDFPGGIWTQWYPQATTV